MEDLFPIVIETVRAMALRPSWRATEWGWRASGELPWSRSGRGLAEKPRPGYRRFREGKKWRPELFYPSVENL